MAATSSTRDGGADGKLSIDSAGKYGRVTDDRP